MATFVAWTIDNNQPMFSISKPYDGELASVGNGAMIAIKCPTTAMVDNLHAKALLLGAQNEGNVGPRQEGFYCGYFRDLDGNKLNFYCKEDM